jgi:hypothetical protein
MARLFGRGSFKMGNVRIIRVEDNYSRLISGEARARRVTNSRATRQARHTSEINDDQHWQFGLRVIPPKACANAEPGDSAIPARASHRGCGCAFTGRALLGLALEPRHLCTGFGKAMGIEPAKLLSAPPA